jgi:hypothetical protein
MRQLKTNEEILQAYRETGSVWGAGKKIGLSGQQVHARLKRMNVDVVGGGTSWTNDEEEELQRLVQLGVPFLEIGQRLDRTFNSIAVRASRLGLKGYTKRMGPRKIPRGQGYDKASMIKHSRALDTSELTLTKYVKQEHLNVEPFVQSMQRNLPDWWDTYLSKHRSDIPEKECSYCKESFIPNSGKQEYCTRRCGEHSRKDASYFGGRRRETIGLKEGVCQLCGRKPEKGLSSHHVYSKRADVDNSALIALCQGCHDVVSRLAGKPWISDSDVVERLIGLAYMQANGASLMRSGKSTYTYVEIEEQDPDDENE